MDGLSLIDQLQKEDIDLPAIITSAHNDTQFLHKAIDLKVKKYLYKPFHMSDLLSAVPHLSETIIQNRESALQKRERKHYLDAIEQTNLVIHIAPDGKLLEINRKLTDFFQKQSTRDQAIRTTRDLLAPHYLQDLLEKTNALQIYSKTILVKFEKQYYTVFLTAFASKHNDENVSEITVMFNNIVPILKEKLLIEQLYTDELTGLPKQRCVPLSDGSRYVHTVSTPLLYRTEPRPRTDTRLRSFSLAEFCYNR